MSSQNFEAFKAHLRRLPRDRVIDCLEEQFDSRSRECQVALNTPESSSLEKRGAVIKLALSAMALQPLVETETSSEHLPTWISFVRARLEDRFTGAFEGSVFFSNSLSPEDFNRLVSSSVVPPGEYDDESFAAGVATGKIRTSV